MLFERALSWVAMAGGGLSPILVAFVVLVIGRSRRRKLSNRRLASGLVVDQDQRLIALRSRHSLIERAIDPPSNTDSPEVVEHGLRNDGTACSSFGRR